MFKCEWCNFTTDHTNAIARHISVHEKHRFSDLESIERYKIKMIYKVTDEFINELITRYKSGIAKYVILKETNIYIVRYLENWIMCSQIFKWCPKGCGKSVIGNRKGTKNNPWRTIYQCQRCDNIYTKKQLINFGNHPW
jgi:hypothetical protein